MNSETALTSAKDNPISDEEVVERVRAGDTALFEILMRRYNQRLYRIARAILGDEREAEEVMLDTYTKAYTHLDQFAGRARFSTWLTKIAVHEALARARRRYRFMEIDALPESDESRFKPLTAAGQDPEQQVLARELSAVLEMAVAALPEIYRTVFLLREVEGMSVAETAECLAISKETVKTRLHRARALLHDKLYQYTGDIPLAIFKLHLLRCNRVVTNVRDRMQPQAY